MTREEIIKAADKAVEMFEGYAGECGGFIRRMRNKQAVECAIICIEREIVSVLEYYEVLFGKSGTPFDGNTLKKRHAILTELKSRL